MFDLKAYLKAKAAELVGGSIPVVGVNAILLSSSNKTLEQHAVTAVKNARKGSKTAEGGVDKAYDARAKAKQGYKDSKRNLKGAKGIRTEAHTDQLIVERAAGKLGIRVPVTQPKPRVRKTNDSANSESDTQA